MQSHLLDEIFLFFLFLYKRYSMEHEDSTLEKQNPVGKSMVYYWIQSKIGILQGWEGKRDCRPWLLKCLSRVQKIAGDITIFQDKHNLLTTTWWIWCIIFIQVWLWPDQPSLTKNANLASTKTREKGFQPCDWWRGNQTMAKQKGFSRPIWFMPKRSPWRQWHVKRKTSKLY